MISIIVCSKDLELLKGLSENVQETIGCKFELIAIDNRKNQYCICSAYNAGIKKAKSSFLCFIHEDIRYLTKNWGELLLKKLQDKKIGVVGIAGTTLLSEDGIWYSAQRPFVQGRVVHSFNGKEQLDKYGTLERDCEVVVLDGLFLSCRKETAEKFRFNDVLFPGFHFYDIDFSLRVSQNFNNIVTYDILLKHFSGGNIGKEFQDSRKKFIELYKHLLPYTKLKNISQIKLPWQTFAYNGKKVYPRVLVGCPTSDSHAYCLDGYMKSVLSLDYTFYDVLIIDNSKDENYKKKIGKTMRAQALFSVLSKKLKDGEILFVETLTPSSIKTKDAVKVMQNLVKVSDWKVADASKKPRILTALFGRNDKTEKSFRNIPSLQIVFLKNLIRWIIKI